MKTLLSCACVILLNAALAGEGAPAFTKKPTASKANGKTVIEFAVDRETDVAVFIEDSSAKIIRHLVAGVLGKSPYPRLSAIRTDGGAGWGREEGPDLLGRGETATKPWLAVSFARPSIAVSGDGQWAYLRSRQPQPAPAARQDNLRRREHLHDKVTERRSRYPQRQCDRPPVVLSTGDTPLLLQYATPLCYGL